MTKTLLLPLTVAPLALAVPATAEVIETAQAGLPSDGIVLGHAMTGRTISTSLRLSF